MYIYISKSCSMLLSLRIQMCLLSSVEFLCLAWRNGSTEKHRNSTELSKHIWTLKDNNIEHFISWRILSSHSPYNSSSKGCNLCLKEKFLIICRPDLSTLNKSIMNSCLPAATETKPSYATTKLLNFALHKLDYIVDKRW